MAYSSQLARLCPSAFWHYPYPNWRRLRDIYNIIADLTQPPSVLKHFSPELSFICRYHTILVAYILHRHSCFQIFCVNTTLPLSTQCWYPSWRILVMPSLLTCIPGQSHLVSPQLQQHLHRDNGSPSFSSELQVWISDALLICIHYMLNQSLLALFFSFHKPVLYRDSLPSTWHHCAQSYTIKYLDI